MRYYTVIEIAYAGGLADDLHEALDALRSALKDILGQGSELVVSSSGDDPRRITVRAELQGDDLTSPLNAITKTDTSIDQALMAIGLFEEFDVSRKTLRVAPWPGPQGWRSR